MEMTYGVKWNDLTVYMTEVLIDNDCLDEDSGYEEKYYLFSDALSSFLSKADQLGCKFFFVSTAQEGAITILATPDSLSFGDDKDVNGPYNDPLVAYGIGRLSRSSNRDYIVKSAAQFSSGTCVVFDCIYDCGEYRFCKVHSPGDLCFNVTPLNGVNGVKSGEQFVLRLLAYTDDVCVFRTPKELTDTMHFPPKAFVPIGTYCSDVSKQDSSAIITGVVQNIGLVSQGNKLKYALTVKTDEGEVFLNVNTHYEIKDGDFIYAVLNDVSALF